jgi:hypothetical protein
MNECPTLHLNITPDYAQKIQVTTRGASGMSNARNIKQKTCIIGIKKPNIKEIHPPHNS